MKSFIFALLMLLSVAFFVMLNSNQTVAHIDEMLALTEKLPQNKQDFENRSEKASLTVQNLTELWKSCFPSISFTAGYENTSRCEEAIIALAMHFENGNGEDFSVSLLEFRDSLIRLRTLEGVYWQGIL